MWRLAWHQVRGRGTRSLVLGLAVLVAATGFTVLTASSDASTLQTVGQVQASAKTTFDILVRPSGARLPVERNEQLIQPGFLTGVFGGISTDQWQTIQQISGVAVAAPTAVVGFVIPRADVFVDTTRFASAATATTLRIGIRWWLGWR
jgi:putative ABC transport system permease protein